LDAGLVVISKGLTEKMLEKRRKSGQLSHFSR
jgi:hypothetical protein